MITGTANPVHSGATQETTELVIRDLQVFSGPGIWSDRPVVAMLVDTGLIDRQDPVLLEQIERGLVQFMHSLKQADPTLVAYTPTADGPTTIDEACQFASCQIVKLAGWGTHEVGIYSAGPASFFLYLEYLEPGVATRALAFAVQVVNSLIANESDVHELSEVFASLRYDFGELDSLERYIALASERGIPVRRFEADDRTIELGTGRYIRRTRGQMSAACTVVGVQNAGDKSLTNKLLSDRGLPVPKSAEVGSAQQAVAAAKRIGFPVVLKPRSGNHGRGVCINLQRPEEVEALFPVAAREDQGGWVVVESFLKGRDFRILVIDDKIAGVTERVPAAVTGDGVHDIRDLIEIENREPTRGKPFENVLNLITIDDFVIDTLRRQDLTLADVPAKGQVVYVRQTANISTGGTSIDRTNDIHPDNAMVALIAAKTIGLGMAGIDIIMPDISESVWETGGGIAEVNSGPGFRLHSRPYRGKPQNVVGAVVDMYYPPGAPVRVPVIALAASPISETIGQLVENIATAAGFTVGLALPDRAKVNGITIPANATDHPTARMVLRNAVTELAVISAGAEDLEIPGLAFEAADVVVLSSRGTSAAGGNGLRIEDVLLRILAPGGKVVLFADDPQAAELVTRRQSNTILVGATDDALISQHTSAGGSAITFDTKQKGSKFTVHKGLASQTIDVSSNEHGQEVMSMAVAAAIAQGIDEDDIRSALGDMAREVNAR